MYFILESSINKIGIKSSDKVECLKKLGRAYSNPEEYEIIKSMDAAQFEEKYGESSNNKELALIII